MELLEEIEEVVLSSEIFPDPQILGFVGIYDSDASGGLSETEIQEIVSFVYPDAGITDITGLEKLTSLKQLDLSGNAITTWTDLTSLVSLTHMDLSQTGKASYEDIAELTNLIQLKLDGNMAGNLDVSKAANLQYLSCKNAGLTSVNVSGLSGLEELYLEGNSLTNLDVSGLSNLEVMTLQQNQLTALDVSACTNLKVLQVDNNMLTELKVTGLTNLEQLDCQNNQLAELNTEGLEKLVQLNVTNNQLASLDISALAALQTVLAADNQLAGEWNLSNLDVVSLQNNQITKLTGENTTISYLNIRNNQLTELTLNSENLEKLYCSDNELTSLTVAGTSLTTLYCDNNKLPYVDTAEALDLNLSPQSITMTRIKNGTSHTVDLTTIMITDDLLNRTSVVMGDDVISVENGIVRFSGAADTMSYHFTTSGDTNAAMLVEVELTEVDETPEGGGNEGDGNEGINDKVALNEEVFTDVNLLAVIRTYDKDGSNGLSEEEIGTITSLVCPDNGITSLKGLEYLTSLTHLDISGNAIGNLAALEELPALTHLDVSRTGMTDDSVLGGLTDLVELKLDGNQLTELELGGFSSLKNLSVNNNQLTTLDVTSCGNLEVLQADNNKLAYVDVSGVLELSLSPQAISMTRVKNGSSHTVDMTTVIPEELLDRVEVVMGEEVISVENGIVSFNKAVDTMSYHFKVSGDSNTTMLVEVSLTEVDETPEGGGNEGGDNDEVALNEEIFTDEKLLGVIGTYDKDGSQGLSEEEIGTITSLVYPDSGITSLKGLEYLTSLTHLDISGNAIEDFSALEELTTLTHLDVSRAGMTDYRVLDGLVNLVELKLDGNPGGGADADTVETFYSLSQEDDGNATEELTALNEETEQEELPVIPRLGISETEETDNSGDTELLEIVSLESYSTDLDVSRAANLQSLSCKDSGLSSISVAGLSSLEELRLEGNQLTELELSGLSSLKTLSVQKNQLTELDVTFCGKLEVLQADNNQLTALNVTGLGNLKQLDCANNALTGLNVEGLDTLQEVNVTNNQLTQLDISGLTDLETVLAANNALTGIWNTGTAGMVSLEGNSITGIEEGSGNLEYLNIRDNQVTELSLSSKNVEKLYCSDNELTSLTVAGDSLTTLYCDNNKLPYVDTAEALDLNLSPQRISINRIKNGDSHTVDLTTVIPEELLDRVEVVMGEEVVSVESGIVSFNTAVDTMSYYFTTSGGTNAAMLVEVELTEVDETPEDGGNESGGNESGGNESGGNESGGNESGGNESGGNESGGNEDGGNTGGGNTGSNNEETDKPIVVPTPEPKPEVQPSPQIPALQPETETQRPAESIPQLPTLWPETEIQRPTEPIPQLPQTEKPEESVEDVVVDTKIVEETASEEVKVAVKETVVVIEEKAKVTTETVEKVLENTEEGATVILPLKEAAKEGQAVKEAEIPVKALEKIAETESRFTMEFEGLKVTFEPEAITAITEQARGNYVEVRVVPVEHHEMKEEQQKVLGTYDVAVRVSAQVFSDGEYIGDFKGGKARIAIPFTPTKGRKVEEYNVYYIADMGDMTLVPSVYADGYMVLETDHFSEYVIVYEGDEEASAVEETEIKKEEVQKEKGGSPILPIIFVIVAIAIVGAAYVAIKKKKMKNS